MRLIDADALRDDVLNDNTYDNDTVNYYLGIIDYAPTVYTVIHGKWQIDEFGNFCSNCKEYVESTAEDKKMNTNYCPNCGAKMDG